VLSPLIGHHHALVFGVFMVLAVLFQPRGLIGLWDKLRARRHRPSAARPRLPAAEAKAVKREGLA